MIEMTLRDVAEATGGRLVDAPDPDARVTAPVEFDSRKVARGGLFVALPGARVDGHDFAAAAVNDSGAAGVLAARPVGVPAVVVEPEGKRAGNEEAFSHDEDGSAAAVAGALGRLARYVADRLTERGRLTVVGITGSAGKTSTKDLLKAVLSKAGETVAPPGSFNNEIGHPYTALRCGWDTEFLVAEMSARGVGHIAHLCRISPPRVGVELNVGTAHVGEFGSREAIARAKGELVEALPASGVAVLNFDDEFVPAMAGRTEARAVTFSASGEPGADYRATALELDDEARASFKLHTPHGEPVDVSLKVHGAHQVANAIAAAAVGCELGLEPGDVAAALSSREAASKNRMAVRTSGGLTVIDDSYNANPDSVRAALTAARRVSGGGRRLVAGLGEMAELGGTAEAEHEAIGRGLPGFGVDALVAVGSGPVGALAEAAEAAGVRVRRASGNDEALRFAREEAGDEAVVVVKASHSQALWEVAEGLGK